MDDNAIVRAMTTFGGSFVKRLGTALAYADKENFERIRAAFPELFEQYAEVARLKEEREAAFKARVDAEAQPC